MRLYKSVLAVVCPLAARPGPRCSVSMQADDAMVQILKAEVEVLDPVQGSASEPLYPRASKKRKIRKQDSHVAKFAVSGPDSIPLTSTSFNVQVWSSELLCKA